MISTFVKIFFIVIFTNLISTKLLNNRYKNGYIFIVLLTSLLISSVYIIIKEYMNITTALVWIYISINFFIKLLNKYKTGYSIIVTLISMAICIVTFGIAILISFIIYKITNINNYIINSIEIGILQGMLIFGFFKIKRFRKGLDFLKDNNKNEYINIIMLTISPIIVLAYYFLAGNYYGDKLTGRIFISLIMLGIIMVLMIKKSLELCYRQTLMKKEIEEFKKELQEKDSKIKKLSNEKSEISRINHEFYNRQQALEMRVKEFLGETSDEIGILDRIEGLSKEYSNSLQNIKTREKLPLTNIQEIDDMFKYMQAESEKNNIEFKLHIEGEIYHLVNEIIQKNKLEMLIGDLIRNAIIAINFNENKNKSILVIFGIKEGNYELCIYDSGIEFKIETLNKLGIEKSTTHKETGGSGIGLMTTFKTLKECKASLEIEEKHEIQEDDYTKAVKVVFDGKQEYRILSYRGDKIKRIIRDKRLIINNLKEETRKYIDSNSNNNFNNSINSHNSNKQNTKK